jgi:hypothetical protein
MSVRPIIDAGPGLNFLSINKERLVGYRYCPMTRHLSWRPWFSESADSQWLNAGDMQRTWARLW